MTGTKQVKEATKKKEWGVLSLYFLVVFIILFFGTLSGIGLWRNATHKEDIRTVKEEAYNPPLDVYYRKTDEKRDAVTGVYTTTFRLFLHTPPYWRPKTTNMGFQFLWSGTKDIECGEQKSVGSQTMTAGAYSSSTEEYEIQCKTNQPVLDNGKLFSVQEN